MANHKYKGRFVAARNPVALAMWQWALFQLIRTVPSTIAACRALHTEQCMTDGSRLLQSDRNSAYVQAGIKGPKMSIRLPTALQPNSVVGDFNNPVCNLLQAFHKCADFLLSMRRASA